MYVPITRGKVKRAQKVVIYGPEGIGKSTFAAQFPDPLFIDKAEKLLDRLAKRRVEGLTTPKQIRFLEGRGFGHVGTWSFESAKALIDRIAGNGWQVPRNIEPRVYRPEL